MNATDNAFLIEEIWKVFTNLALKLILITRGIYHAHFGYLMLTVVHVHTDKHMMNVAATEHEEQEKDNEQIEPVNSQIIDTQITETNPPSQMDTQITETNPPSQMDAQITETNPPSQMDTQITETNPPSQMDTQITETNPPSLIDTPSVGKRIRKRRGVA